MIPRYSRPQMAAIWAPESRFRIWFEIEAHACDAMAELGIVPKASTKAIWDGGAKAMAALKADPKGEIEKIDAIERVTKHDIIAFTTWLGEYIGPDSRFVHQGLTSSDVLDTTFAVQLTQAADILLADLDKLLAALKKRALEHKDTLTIGRSHAIHAEPTTFGVKLAGHYAAFTRNRARLVTARAEIATCAISGPVGTFANIDPRVEAHVANKLGLAVEPVSTQVIPRDRHAAFFAALGVCASSIENLATEIRHLQRTEVREAEEFFSPGQKGSSSMPHKRNPVLTENVTGLARLVRGAVMPALENVTLWHERDISHSSTERFIAPDATGTLDFALNRIAGVVEQLVVYKERMQANLDSLGGLVFSQRILLALTQKGMSREASYAAVQRNAMEAWRGNASLLSLCRADKEIREFLADDELTALFDMGYHTKHVDTIFKRVFG
jgi:adenylosuccinate lyase